MGSKNNTAFDAVCIAAGAEPGFGVELEGRPKRNASFDDLVRFVSKQPAFDGDKAAAHEWVRACLPAVRSHTGVDYRPDGAPVRKAKAPKPAKRKPTKAIKGGKGSSKPKRASKGSDVDDLLG